MSKAIPAKNQSEVAVKETSSIESFIIKAIENNTPVEIMEKLFNLREKVKAEQAKAAFVEAMSNFQANCPIIKKTKKVMNKDGKTVRYVYAPIDSIVEQIKKPLSENHLAYTWSVKNETGFIIATAIITHSMGHSESSEFKVPIGSSEYMTAPQACASALTFAKRYSLCNSLGISTGDEDDDATTVRKEEAAKSQKSQIVFLLKSLQEDVSTKETIQLAVDRLTKLALLPENYDDIVGRLQVIVSENNENTEVR